MRLSQNPPKICRLRIATRPQKCARSSCQRLSLSIHWIGRKSVRCTFVFIVCTISINISSFRPADGYLEPLSKSFARCVSDVHANKLALRWNNVVYSLLSLDWFPFIYGQDHQLGRDNDDDEDTCGLPGPRWFDYFYCLFMQNIQNCIFTFYVIELVMCICGCVYAI